MVNSIIIKHTIINKVDITYSISTESLKIFKTWDDFQIYIDDTLINDSEFHNEFKEFYNCLNKNKYNPVPYNFKFI